MNWRNLTLVVCVSGLLITLSTWVANVSVSKLPQPKQPPTQLSVKQLRSSAQAITVAVPIETVRHPPLRLPACGAMVYTQVPLYETLRERNLTLPYRASLSEPTERERFPRSQVVPRFPRSRALRGNA
jgi:hypothetical protein